MVVFLQRIYGFAKLHPIGTFFIILGLVIYVPMGVYAVLHPPTAQQLQADAQAEQARKAAEAATVEQERYLCRLATVCKKFESVRQDCATAGNFGNCIKVKMGDDDAGLIDSCTNDGKLLYTPEQMPDGLRCFIFRHGG